jgi:hypothetical protein
MRPNDLQIDPGKLFDGREFRLPSQKLKQINVTVHPLWNLRLWRLLAIGHFRRHGKEVANLAWGLIKPLFSKLRTRRLCCGCRNQSVNLNTLRWEANESCLGTGNGRAQDRPSELAYISACICELDFTCAALAASVPWGVLCSGAKEVSIWFAPRFVHAADARTEGRL